ncbi:ABC transporter substrate-binding protein [Bacillus spongiae]|uniref:ABC transporter substrate-binding protein n=1 Tax=Bacillus spongiae TaxID=2683610 RepID=A0ABU8HH09_9BACI
MKKLFSLLFVLLSFGLAGCGEDEKKTEETKKPATEQTEEKAAFPVTLTDSVDNEVTLEAKPEKIVSIMPSITEILFAVGSGEEVVAGTDFDNYPEEAQNLEKIGGMEFNVEKIISLQPDLVLAPESGYALGQTGLEQIEEAGIPVLVVDDATNFDEVYASIEFIGKATGHMEEASNIIEDMKTTLNELKEKASSIEEAEKKNVFIEVSGDPLFTVGTSTFMHEILMAISANNVVEEEGWVELNEEKVVSLNPDVVITTYGEGAAEQVLAREGWQGVSAISNEEVYEVNSDLVSRPGPRLVQGVEEVAKVIYPEVFTNE